MFEFTKGNGNITIATVKGTQVNQSVAVNLSGMQETLKHYMAMGVTKDQFEKAVEEVYKSVSNDDRLDIDKYANTMALSVRNCLGKLVGEVPLNVGENPESVLEIAERLIEISGRDAGDYCEFSVFAGEINLYPRGEKFYNQLKNNKKVRASFINQYKKFLKPIIHKFEKYGVVDVSLYNDIQHLGQVSIEDFVNALKNGLVDVTMREGYIITQPFSNVTFLEKEETTF